jgi:hypothetical protein
MLQSVLKYGFIHDAATSLCKAFLGQFEITRGKDRETFASTFEGHRARIAMTDIKIDTKINTHSNCWLTSARGKSWADWQKCGYTSEAAWEEAIRQERLEYLISANRDVIPLFVRAIFRCRQDDV